MPSVTIHKHQSERLASCVERSLREHALALGCAPGGVSAALVADGCCQLACVLYHGRSHDGVGDCVSDRLQGTSADVFALCLFWAVNNCGLRAVAVPLAEPVEN